MRHSVSLVMMVAALAACNGHRDRSVGQTSFDSAPPNGGGRAYGEDADGGAAGGPAPLPPALPTSERTVEETDLYRLEGDRLYYLNAYRGLMVFDVSSPDRPVLLGRSAVFGQPVDMIVRNGVAIVVIGDWFGTLDDGSPFRGSIVRGLDASDPANIRVIGEAKLGGWVRDDRVVGDVIYAVSEDYGWGYGWGGDGDVSTPDGPSGPTVVVSSVSFANGKIEQVDELRFEGFSGVFHVTSQAILLASVDRNQQPRTSLLYLDISDPAGEIAQRGSLTVAGAVNGWGADNGRWNLDFSDGKLAHVVAQEYGNYYSNSNYVLSTVDFTNPGAPQLVSALTIPNSGWSAAARFDNNRLYLSPYTGYYNAGTTPLQVYDLSVAAAPRLAGTVQVPGVVWNILPAPGSRLFALGNDYQQTKQGDPVTLHYLDVTNPAAPALLGTSTFGDGWAWTPAAGTFKAFTMDTARGLVVLPFSGWDYNGRGYNNGLQLIEFSASSLTTAGAARTKGWVERGIFVGDRLLSLSNQALAVVDYQNPMAPRVVNELTLARNVVSARAAGQTIAQVSSDWWDNDKASSEVRVLPLANAEETADVAAVATLNVDGVNARVFNNGRYAYIVTSVQTPKACPSNDGPSKGAADGSRECFERAQQIQVVDIAEGRAVALGKLQLPSDGWNSYGWGFYGCYWYDWWGGDEVVQVGGDVLAFRRWQPIYDPQSGRYLRADSKLFVVDLANPAAPAIASVVMDVDVEAWWGNMKVVGTTLYTTDYEWIDDPRGRRGWVRYYLNSIDLGDRKRPRIGARVNVPGFIVGGDASDPSIVYTVDYRWDDDSDNAINDFDVVRIRGSRATLLSHTRIDGWVGSTFIQGKTAYLSAQRYNSDVRGGAPKIDLHAIDLSNPSRPRDRVATDNGWGWLLAVEGDRALVTSGWGSQGLDVYRLRDGQAPRFEQTIRTRGWTTNGVSRQGDTLYLSSGYWGVQAVALD